MGHGDTGPERAATEDTRLWTKAMIDKAVDTALLKLGPTMRPSAQVMKGAIAKAVDETDTPHRTTPTPPTATGDAHRRAAALTLAAREGDSPDEVVARAKVYADYVENG